MSNANSYAIKLRTIVSVLFVVILLSFPSVASSDEHLLLEKEYQNVWCAARKGMTEVVVNNKYKVRADCITTEYAVEFDFAKKWYEGMTQAKTYAMFTEKKAALVLITEKESDQKFVELARLYIAFYKEPVELFVMDFKDMPSK